MKVLVCGHNSFVAKGLVEKMQAKGYDVDCFSRGNSSARKDNVITGDVFELLNNDHFSSEYDVIINFIIIKDGSIADNLRYIKALHDFCIKKKASFLFHISSVSVYKNEEEIISDFTPIEQNIEKKGVYAMMKVAVDNYLLEVEEKSCQIVFIRPGFVFDGDVSRSFAGISMQILGNIYLLLGNKQTTLATIEKSRLHASLVGILELEEKKTAYNLVMNSPITKYDFVKGGNRIIIPLPKRITLPIAKILCWLRVFNKKQYHQIEGLFKVFRINTID